MSARQYGVAPKGFPSLPIGGRFDTKESATGFAGRFRADTVVVTELRNGIWVPIPEHESVGA